MGRSTMSKRVGWMVSSAAAATLAVAGLFIATGGNSAVRADDAPNPEGLKDRKSTRLNSSHRCTSYAVFCLKKKFAPQAVKHLSQLHIFGRQGSLTYASRIRLHHAYYAIDPIRWHSAARTRATRSCICGSKI